MFKVNLTRKVEARLCASRDAEGVVKEGRVCLWELIQALR